MPYKKTIWENNLPPSIDEFNLGKMEEGIYQNSLRIEDLITLTTQHSADIAKINEDLDKLTGRVTTAENDIKGIKGDITGINNTLATKANKADVPTNADLSSQLAKYVLKTDYNSAQSTTNQNITNLQNAVNNVYTKAQSDDRYLLRSNGSGVGTHTFQNIRTTSAVVSNAAIGIGGHTLYMSSWNPGGSYGDVWIKNG